MENSFKIILIISRKKNYLNSENNKYITKRTYIERKTQEVLI